MKSFFKKLAFVMAMAMVVSLAAPAAAQAAELPLYLAYQNETDEVKVHKMTALEETVDFCFKGAQTGWRELERGWSSSNETVATVDDNGLVTAVGYGSATIKFELDGYTDATVLVVVEEPVAPDTFEVVQKTEAKFDLVFAGETKYTADDVKLFIVYENAADPTDPIEIKWPIKSASKKDNTITVEPFVAFNDGDRYMLQVGDLEPVFADTVIGEVTKVEITPSTNQVYANETAEDGQCITFTAKLFSGDIDLTNLYMDDATITYKVTASDNDTWSDDVNEDGDYELYFWEEGITAAVQATCKIGKKEFTSNSVGVESKKLPAWGLVGVVDWAVVKTDATTVDWTKKTVPADATDKAAYQIVLKLKDTREKTYVTHAGCTEVKNGVPTHIYVGPNTEDAITEAGYILNFYSADTDSMLVSLNGQFKVYKECEAVYYVGLVDTNNDDAEKYIWADTLVVEEGSKLDEVKLDKTSVDVVTLTLDAGDTSLNGTVTATAEDQYNEPWTNVKYSLSVTDEVKNTKAISVNETTGVVTVDGTKLHGLNKSSVEVTVKGKDPITGIEKTAKFTVNITRPKTEVVNSETVIVLDKIIKSKYYETYEKVTIKTNDVDLYVGGIDESKVANADTVVAKVTLDKTSDGATVGKYTGITIVESDAEINALTEESTRYLYVKNSKGYVAKENIKWNGTTLEILLAEPDGDEKMTYGDLGEYTVTVVTVRYNKNTHRRNDYVVDESFNVTRTEKKIDFAAKISNTYKEADKVVSATDYETLADVVVETLSFTRGGAEWKKLDADMITKVDAVVLDDYVIIKNVYFNVPVDGENMDRAYDQYIVSGINVSVQYDEDAE